MGIGILINLSLDGQQESVPVDITIIDHKICNKYNCIFLKVLTFPGLYLFDIKICVLVCSNTEIWDG